MRGQQCVANEWHTLNSKDNGLIVQAAGAQWGLVSFCYFVKENRYQSDIAACTTTSAKQRGENKNSVFVLIKSKVRFFLKDRGGGGGRRFIKKK